MDRVALEHVLRAAAAITDEREFIVIGSQSVLGQFPNAPAALLTSVEVDVYPRHAPEKSDLIDGAIGELSMFHQTFGYYAHGVVDARAASARWKDIVGHLEGGRAAYRNSGASDRDIAWAIQQARVVLQGLQIRANEVPRDRSMAGNVQWILDQNPSAKMVVFA